MNPPVQINTKSRITPEGEAAAARIAAERNGDNRQLTSGGKLVPNKTKPTPIQPTVSAQSMVNPPAPVTVPTPTPATIPPRIDTMANNVLGSIRSRSETARRLEEDNRMIGSFVENNSGVNIQNEALDRFGVTPDRLKRLEEVEMQLAGNRGESALRQVRIEGAAGQTMGQAQREVTQEQREEAVRSATLAAEAAVLTDNINLGRELARDAVTVALADRDLKYTNLIRQNNELSKQVDEETRQLLQAENRKYEEKLAEDTAIKKSIEDAIVSGAASPEELQRLTALLPTHPDPAIEEQLQMEALAGKRALAQGIVGRGASELRDLEVESKRSDIAANYASINLAERKFQHQQHQDALANEIEILKADGQMSEEQVANTQKVDQALQLKDLVSQIRGHAGFNLSVGPLASRIANPLEGGLTGQLYNKLSGQGEGFDGLYDQLTDSLTLSNLDKMKGVLTDKDIQVLRSASNRLRKGTTETEFLGVLNEMEQTFDRSVQQFGLTPEQAKFYYNVEDDAISEVDAMWGVPSASASNTINFDY